MMTNALCPCGSTLTYVDCCQPRHTFQKPATTAEALMRSRYTAFVMQDSDYIVATTVPFQQSLLDKQAIADWAAQTDWAGLEVLQHTPKFGKRHAQVEFKAFFNTANGKACHHELSTFVNMGNQSDPRWYFVDPTVSMTIPQKQPCPCGSGEKYKRCCGRFL